MKKRTVITTKKSEFWVIRPTENEEPGRDLSRERAGQQNESIDIKSAPDSQQELAEVDQIDELKVRPERN